jgi:hypothetical protein
MALVKSAFTTIILELCVQTLGCDMNKSEYIQKITN